MIDNDYNMIDHLEKFNLIFIEKTFLQNICEFCYLGNRDSIENHDYPVGAYLPTG